MAPTPNASFFSILEAIGMALPFSSCTPAVYPEKAQECHRAGYYMRNLLANNIRPLDIMTRQAFLNSVVLTMALCGSTNAVLHLLAVARAARVELTLDDFQRIAEQVPVLADMAPSGRYLMEDLHKVGGVPAVIKYLIDQGLMDGSTLTVTGKTLAENVSHVPALDFDKQDVIRPVSNPIKATGHLRILKGSLAPGGAVGKLTGKEGLRFEGTAMCFDTERGILDAIAAGKLKKGHVIVIRYQGE